MHQKIQERIKELQKIEAEIDTRKRKLTAIDRFINIVTEGKGRPSLTLTYMMPTTDYEIDGITIDCPLRQPLQELVFLELRKEKEKLCGEIGRLELSI